MSKISFLRTELLTETRLVGHRLKMSFVENKTGQLWRGFMPVKDKIKNRVNNYLYSVEEYNSSEFIKNFNPNVLFNKWAAVAVDKFENIPATMETLVLPEGLYAVFLFQGSSSEGATVYQYMFNSWLPQSKYKLDDRPHFALMGSKYLNNDPRSEEELWIPVKEK